VSKRGIAITGWLVVGHAILGALYWLLLQVPESNVFMLSASLLVVIALIGWAGVVQATAVIGWVPGTRAAAALVQGTRRAAWIAFPLALFVLVWLATGHVQNWLAAHRGEFDAWFIARFGWTDAGAFHTAVRWLLWFVRYGVGVSLAAALFASVVTTKAPGASPLAWASRGGSWRSLLITTAMLWVGIWLPWHYLAAWRPASLSVSWVQPAFAAAKLTLLFIVMNVAWAVVLWWATKQAGAAAPAVVVPATESAPSAPPQA
jgi:hypothetical protein